MSTALLLKQPVCRKMKFLVILFLTRTMDLLKATLKAQQVYVLRVRVLLFVLDVASNVKQRGCITIIETTHQFLNKEQT